MRPQTAYPSNCISLIYKDFLPNQYQEERKKVLPGPGKYETVDDIGNIYHTKSKNAGVRSFHGR